MSTVNKQPVRVPLVDPATGVITREWYRFFEQMFVRVGGDSAMTNVDLDNGLQFDIREADAAEVAKRVDALEVADTANLNARIAELEKRLNDLPEIEALAAQLAEALKRIESLEMAGTFV